MKIAWLATAGERNALQVLANDAAGSGLFLLLAAGGEALLVDALGYDARWHGRGRLLFNHENGPHVYDLEAGKKQLLDLPQGSRIVGQ